jgi:eukaryotic-like serine/threonine-protein kinase
MGHDVRMDRADGSQPSDPLAGAEVATSGSAAPDTPRHTDRATAPVGDAVSMFAVGSLVAGYRVEQIVATGATGTVYLAKNPTLPRRDALKVLSADLSRDTAFRERFVREADIASMLSHPNIVPIYNRGEAANGQLWIAMQYVAGTDAEAALQAGTMTTSRALRIAGEVAKALDYAHRRNVVHHDVKPGNVLLAHASPDGEQVLLSDFGVARAAGGPDNASDDSTLAVTLAYAAPEVITGGAVDGRADIYSLACTLFRLLTGKPPYYSAHGVTELALAHVRQPPPRITDHLPGATHQTDAVFAKALSKSPADRYTSAREFAAAAAASLSQRHGRASAQDTAGRDRAEHWYPPRRQYPETNRLQPNRAEMKRNFHSAAETTAPRNPPTQRPLVILWSIFAIVFIAAAVLWIIVLSR